MGKAYIRKIAVALQGVESKVIIEGYTDSVPIHTAKIPSNWHLSALRAAEVAFYLNKYGVDSKYLEPIGMGAFPTNSDIKESRRVNIYLKPLEE